MDGALRRGPLADLTQYINPDINNTRVQNAIGSHAFGFQRKTAKPDTYKTVMCQAWLESMKCTFGENCKFAHGEHELRPVRFNSQARNNLKYKTKLCDKYTTTGICPYGSRCLFIHPAPSKQVAKPPSQVSPTPFRAHCSAAPGPHSQTAHSAAAPEPQPPGLLQQQLELIRQQYGPNSLHDFPSMVQQLWGPPSFFSAAPDAPAGCAAPAVPSVEPPVQGRHCSFSGSSAPSSAFGSSNSLGSTAAASATPWPWAEDLPLSPPAPAQLRGLHAAQLAFHNSLPGFGAPSALALAAGGTTRLSSANSSSCGAVGSQGFGLLRSTPASSLGSGAGADELDEEPLFFAAGVRPLSGTEEQGEQLARSVARALEIDL